MPQYITDLSAEQILAINVFLAEHNESVFDEKQLAFIADLDNADVLYMADCLSFVRGRFDFTSTGNGHIGFDRNLKNHSQLFDEYESLLDPADYDEVDYKKLIMEAHGDIDSKIAVWGLTLSSAVRTSTLVLYLNNKMQPLFVNQYNSFD